LFDVVAIGSKANQVLTFLQAISQTNN